MTVVNGGGYDGCIPGVLKSRKHSMEMITRSYITDKLQSRYSSARTPNSWCRKT